MLETPGPGPASSLLLAPDTLNQDTVVYQPLLISLGSSPSSDQTFPVGQGLLSHPSPFLSFQVALSSCLDPPLLCFLHLWFSSNLYPISLSLCISF